MDQKHYVPIMKSKTAEYRSLKKLSPEQKDRLTPLLEVQSIPWDFSEDRPTKTIDQHLEKLPDQVEDCWGPNRLMFVDFALISDEERMADGSHPVSYVFDRFKGKNLEIIPVIRMRDDLDYQFAVRRVANKDGRGVCLRLSNEDIEDFDERADLEIDRFLRKMDLSPEVVDFVVDLGEITSNQAGPIIVAVKGVLNMLPHVSRWRSLILSATAFPRDMKGFLADDISRTPRTEWNVWARLVRKPDTVTRVPTFSDYGISNPISPEIDPRIMQMSANLRYTYWSEWLILKGRNVKLHGYGQSQALCRKLIDQPEYSGKEFSWGDDWIWKCANGNVSPGNATTWREVGTTHHISLVMEQIQWENSAREMGQL